MNRLQTPEHNRTRSLLRRTGPILLGIGLLLLVIGIGNFFWAMFAGGMPRLFWCCFLAMPLLFAGTVMCLFGFMGALARYTAAEQVPVASDAINDLADGTQGAVKTLARSVGEGFREGMGGSQKPEPPSRPQ